jgi:hypothetical protein
MFYLVVIFMATKSKKDVFYDPNNGLPMAQGIFVVKRLALCMRVSEDKKQSYCGEGFPRTKSS